MNIRDIVEGLDILIRKVQANNHELKAQNKRIENLEYELEMVKSELSRRGKVRQ